MAEHKKYTRGMYGGKFMPMHKGHLHCLKVAAEMCDYVYLILMLNGKQDEQISSEDHRDFLSVESRVKQITRAAMMFPNVTPIVLDLSACRDENGEEDWDKETPIVLGACGKFDAVFGSEPSYAEYFERAYPWADYVQVDVNRETVPISATKIRAMGEEEALQWMV